MSNLISVNFSELVGKTLSNIDQSIDKIVFTTQCGQRYEMFHDQDCCESVWLEDVCGDLQDLVGTPIIVATESTNDKYNESDYSDDDESDYSDNDESNYSDNDEYGTTMWTFYSIRTNKGSVTLRWCGTSNGYYSVGVSFYLNESPIEEASN